MITLQLREAQRQLPALADKALRGEEVYITVGQQRLRLAPTTSESNEQSASPRPGRGTWKGRVTIPDAFYEPWSTDEMGDSEV